MRHDEDSNVKDEPREDEREPNTEQTHDEKAAEILEKWTPRSEAVRRAMRRSRE